jgi:peptidylprolyl isomerase
MTTTTINPGDSVTLHYKGTLEDGTVFDSSHDRGEPITVTAGTGQLISGFDTALTGMGAGETKTFTVSPEEAYGPRDENATTTLNKSIFPDDFTFTENMTVPLQGPQGGPILATLTEITGDSIVADLNHPMAGKDLTFEVEVITIASTTTDEETTS